MFNPLRSELCGVWFQADPEKRNDSVLEYVKKKTGGGNFTPKHKTVVIRFFSILQQKWRQCKRNRSHFHKRNAKWLSGQVFPGSWSRRDIQPKKDFAKLTLRSKRRRVADLRQARSASELSFAAQMNARSEGNEDAAKLLTEAMQSTPTRSTRIRKAWKVQNVTPAKLARKLTEEEALCFYVEGNFSKSLWISMRQNNKICNVLQIYPSYPVLMKARKKCIPSNEYISVSESTSEVTLQALLDHTAEQLVVLQDEVLLTISDAELDDLELICKWGFDGSSGQSNYKQVSTDKFDDSSIFVTSLVPVQMRVKSCPSKIIWQNIRSSSTRFCRPIRIQFVKETKELIISEKQNVDKQIAQLNPTIAKISNRTQVNISHTLICSMVDGKVCSAVSELSCQKCYVCGASPKEFNNITKIQKKIPNKEMFNFGMSPLHCHIRFMECLLHIAYRLDVTCWQARKPHEKESIAGRKKHIQEAFKHQTGLIIDVPKQGSGSSNDGNTARKFFGSPSVSASITGISVDLIEKFSNILTIISSGFEINADLFQVYCIETAQQFVTLYGWYKMPSSVHRVLIHGADIVRTSIIPVGTLSEEPQECRNKDIKKFREHRARKCSREATNQDIFNRLMVSSDPLISSMRKIPKRKSIPFRAEALKFLKEPSIVLNQMQCSSSDEDWEENDEL